jgi:hypothetical protein
MRTGTNQPAMHPETLLVLKKKLGCPCRLSWYTALSDPEKALADSIAIDLAIDLFDARLGALTKEECIQLLILTTYAFDRTPLSDRP